MTLFSRLSFCFVPLSLVATAALASGGLTNTTFVTLPEHPTQPTVVRVLIDSGATPPGTPTPPANLHIATETGGGIWIHSILLDSPYFELVSAPLLPAFASLDEPLDIHVRATGVGNGLVSAEMYIAFGEEGLMIADLVAWIDVVDGQDFASRSRVFNFENGNLNGWTGTYGVPPAVTTAAALTGSYGMATSWYGVTDQSFVHYTAPGTQFAGKLLSRMEFELNLTALALPTGIIQAIAAQVDSVGTAVGWLQIRRSDSLTFEVRALARLDSGLTVATGWLELPGLEVQLMFDWWAATTPGANNGGVRVRHKSDPWGKEVRTLDNDAQRAVRARLGALWGVTSATEGEAYFDEVVLKY